MFFRRALDITARITAGQLAGQLQVQRPGNSIAAERRSIRWRRAWLPP